MRLYQWKENPTNWNGLQLFDSLLFVKRLSVADLLVEEDVCVPPALLTSVRHPSKNAGKSVTKKAHSLTTISILLTKNTNVQGKGSSH